MMSKRLTTTACAGLLALAAGFATQTVQAQDPKPAAQKVDESGDPSPFPPGPNAMLVKQTCSQCHTPNVVLSQTFNEKTARKIYQKMLGESPDTERGKKIVEYLSTVMGEKDEQ
jgi:mono/diheme cytochrome c family protein